jgi:hypothetical protein
MATISMSSCRAAPSTIPNETLDQVRKSPQALSLRRREALLEGELLAFRLRGSHSLTRDRIVGVSVQRLLFTGRRPPAEGLRWVLARSRQPGIRPSP